MPIKKSKKEKQLTPVQKDLKSKLVDIIIFVTIVILTITAIFNLNLVFFQEPEYKPCYQDYKMGLVNQADLNCNYDETIIKDCQEAGGQTTYGKNCSTTCDMCYKQQDDVRKAYEKKATWFRIILSLIVSLALAFIIIKDKLIAYALITGSLLAMVFSTITAYEVINHSLFPIITIIELAIVLFIYKRLIRKE
ncbi:MAG: hypothetical protein V1824_02460 [archaeon]